MSKTLEKLLWPGRVGIGGGPRPAGPIRINKGSDQAYGLWKWWPVSTPVGDDLPEIVDGINFMTHQSSPASWQFDAEMGWYADYDGAASNYHLAANVIDLSTVDFSLTAWVYVNTFISNAGVIVIGDLDTPWERAEIACTSSEFRGRLSYADATEHSVFSVNPLVTGQWYFLAVTFDRDGDMTFYTDGIAPNTTDVSTKSAQSITCDDPPRIGQSIGSEEINGRVLDVRLYDYVLDASTVRAMQDVPTRWELYQETRRLFYSLPTAAVGGIIPRITYHRKIIGVS